MARNNETEIMAIAARIARDTDGASVARHIGDRGHRAVRVCGAVYPEEAKALAHRIAEAIKSAVVDFRDYPAVRCDAGPCARMVAIMTQRDRRSTSSSAYQYGVAIIDTQAGTCDWGHATTKIGEPAPAVEL